MYICIIWMHCLSCVKKHFKVANDSMKLIPKVENPYREWMWCTAHITYPDIAAWLISIMLSHDSSCDCFLASLTLHVPDQLQFSPERLLDHNNSTCWDYEVHPNIVPSLKHQTILAKHLACCVHFLKQPCKVIFVDMSMGWQSMYTTTSMFLLPYVLGHLLMVVEWMLWKIVQEVMNMDEENMQVPKNTTSRDHLKPDWCIPQNNNHWL